MRALVEDGELGELYYYDSVRVNLGLFQPDVDVIWDLAVHDLSIMDYVFSSKPAAVSAAGMSHVEGKPTNVAFLTGILRGQRDRPPARELAGSGQDPPDPDRREPEDDRLRRP